MVHPDDKLRLLQIVAPHFVAGVTINAEGRVKDVAPIVKYMKRWSEDIVCSYCLRKGWTVREVLNERPS